MAKILAAIDGSTYATSICDHAGWFAARTGAAVQLVHVIERGHHAGARIDLSGSVGLGASEALMEELARADEERGRIARIQGRALLDGAEKRLRQSGVNKIDFVHRHGEVAETLIDLEGEADLVVMGKRGESGNYSHGHLGSKVERVVRESVRPVLVVPRVFMPITRVVVAFDAGPSSTKALRHIASYPAFQSIPCTVVIVAEHGQADMRVAAAEEAGKPAFHIEVLGGPVEDGLRLSLRRGEGDLLVMGAYGHSRIRELVVGSTTTTMIRTSKLPVLLFR